MNENLPIRQEKNLFTKIKNFLRSLFYKNEKTEKVDENNTEVIVNDAKRENFNKSIRAEVKDEYLKDIERNDLFEKIRKNSSLLEDLSDERLEKLSEYYDKLIENNAKLIEAKKNEIKRLKKV